MGGEREGGKEVRQGGEQAGSMEEEKWFQLRLKGEGVFF